MYRIPSSESIQTNFRQPQSSVAVSSSDKEGEAPEIYNCCGKPYGEKFMIFCEKCEEWFHGECINIEQVFANNIEKFYCKPCLGLDPSLQIVFTKKYIMKIERMKREEEEMQAARCQKCPNCLKVTSNGLNCKTCNYCLNGQPKMCLLFRCIQVPNKKKAGRPRKDQNPASSHYSKSTSDDDDGITLFPFVTPALEPFLPPPSAMVGLLPAAPSSSSSGFNQQTPVDPNKPKRGRKKGWKKPQAEKVKEPERPADPQQEMIAMDMEIARQLYRTNYSRPRSSKKTPTGPMEPLPDPEQCHGIECVKEARVGSKYCSDQCGRSIARIRLQRYLPPRIGEYWKNTPESEGHFHLLAKDKEKQILTIQGELKKLVDMGTMLERYVNSLTKAQVGGDVDDGPENDGISLCTVCAHEVNNKQLAAHIFRCFVRHEKQTAFGSGTQDDQYNLFCNEHNKVSNTYCKRLKVICPEHYKGELENNMKVCGCPKIWDSIKDKTPSIQEIFVSAEQLMSKRFCLAPRKECSRHGRWFQIALGVINNTRLNLLYKLNEIQEAYLTYTNAVNMHGDVITLLCSRERPEFLKKPTKEIRMSELEAQKAKKEKEEEKKKKEEEKAKLAEEMRHSVIHKPRRYIEDESMES